MRATRAGWSVLYAASWVVATAPVGAFAAHVVAVGTGGSANVAELAGSLGGLGGVGVGLFVARRTFDATAVHRGLRLVGPAVLALGGSAAIGLFWLSGARRQPGVMFSGFTEFVLGLLATGVALVGAALWLAGVSGRRIGAAVAA